MAIFFQNILSSKLLLAIIWEVDLFFIFMTKDHIRFILVGNSKKKDKALHAMTLDFCDFNESPAVIIWKLKRISQYFRYH